MRSRAAILIVVGATLAAALWITGVMYPRWATGQETWRLASPDGRVELVLLGAHPWIVTHHKTLIYHNSLVYIVPAGAHVRDYPWWLGGDRPVLTGSGFVNDFGYHWEAPHTLDLSYCHSRISSFTSAWSSPRVDAGNYVVDIRLQWRDLHLLTPSRDLELQTPSH